MELAILIALVAAFVAVGFALGMLVAPRIGRWADRDDEETGDDGPG